MTKTPPFHLILPVIDGRPAIVPENTAQVIAEVRRIHAGGYDFVKPYDDLTEEQYLGAIAEAKRLGMYVAGHALDQISLEAVMTSGIDEIVHLDELNFHHWKGKPGEAEFEMDYAAIPETAALMTANGVNIVSNLSLDEALIEIIYDTEATLARPEYWVVRPETKAYWRNSGRQLRQFADQGPYRRDIEIPFFLVLVKALHDAGVIVTTGTDTAEFTEGSLPSHIHRELELLVEAGLSNFEALSAGTRNAAEIVRRMDCDGSFGTIEVGQRADLLLLRENPLDDVSRTRERIGVTVRGRWYPQSKLDEMVAAFVDIY